jgi:hypothetical protein
VAKGASRVISFDTTLFGPASTLYGIEQAAHLAGYYVSVASNKTISRATVLDGLERLPRSRSRASS